MENAADALKMAAWVLIFVAALSISINAFAQARQTTDFMIEASDREYLQTYVKQSDTTERIVGMDYIIPSIYRSFNENYKIVFKDKSGNEIKLYTKYDSLGHPLKDDNGNDISNVYYIDLEKEKVSDSSKEEFIKRILFGAKKDSYEKTHFPYIKFEATGLWDKYKGSQFKEDLGIYYQEETNGGTNTPTANKTLKRVITYTLQ